MANESKNSKSSDDLETPPKLKASDKIWVGLAIAIFVILFIIILLFDVL